ncbi:extracellular solute-binding protein [Jeotgalibacillus campisalis]|uniref:ABC transporter substrate-binding protein n=1 Tax=Jeotgalibacillus campisalis TaxID=220754 RepID=A0A0C2W363_9BACL|nr:extracellular solute-binding protein [Jeotgalibacillus campisalis]KIL51061.1 hypothetical protein KR50_09420 [Jeotgalibacillus campisalis]
MKFSIMMILFCMLMASGCADQSIINEKNQSSSHEDEKETLVMWHTYSEVETSLLENVIIPLFEEEYPDIKIEPARQSHNPQLEASLIARASSKKVPDIIRMDLSWVPSFARLNLLHPVSQFEDFEEIKARFYERPLESNYYKGDYYGIPLNTNTRVAIYNKQLLEQTGSNEPPDTMEELIEVIKKYDLTIGISDLRPWDTLHYFKGLGGELTDSSYTQASGYLDSEESIEAFKTLLSLYQEGYLPEGLLVRDAQTWEGITDGSYFMIDEGPWFYSTRSNERLTHALENTLSAPFPGSNGERGVLGGENLVISKATKHKEAAWIFLKWMSEKEPQMLLAQTGLIPSNKTIEMTGYYDQYPYFEPYLASLEEAVLRPPVAQWREIEEIYTDMSLSIFSGSVGVEEALKNAAEQIDQLLEDGKDDQNG